MDDAQILRRIGELVDEEHQLRSSSVAGSIEPEEEQGRLRQLEETLDQCWDLLRQRRAARESDHDPEGAKLRPIQQVEGYLQ